ncbi:MAG: hypothetical protein Q4E07_04290, partial [Eubacteriales bacterium]|nr:hypothetical protein [Eubacteriales bacterium]
MESNMKRYLAMVEWQLRNLPKKQVERIMQDLRYEMELKKIREGLTEDELILEMETPSEIARKYGGMDTPMYASDVEKAEEAALEKEQEKKHKADKRKRLMEEVREDFRKDVKKQKKGSSSTPANIVKGLVGLAIFLSFLDFTPSIIGGFIGLFFSALSALIVIPIM